MKIKSLSDNFASQFFGLSDKNVKFRVLWFIIASLSVWFILSGLTMIFTLYGVREQDQSFILVRMSLFKYVPALAVLFFLSQKKAARYLVDVYELSDEKIALKFLEEVVFGSEHEKITIKEGGISEDDEKSSVILIGGPGSIQVNLDSVALLEKMDGEPEIISPQRKPWKLGRFERIREVRGAAKGGKREYAIISLRDQFISGLAVKSRTKDGIPLEAQDIKVMFSILRGEETRGKKVKGYEYTFDKKAVRSLVYDQAVLKPAALASLGLPFPWNTTVRPLITSELEDLITSHTLSEILVTVGQKEVSNIDSTSLTIVHPKIEKADQQAVTRKNFESRSKITAQFYTKAFKEKAAEIGLSIEWIDVGTWRLPNSIILDKHKDAWNLARENAKKREEVVSSSKRLILQEIIALINQVFSPYNEETQKFIYYNSKKDEDDSEDGLNSRVSFNFDEAKKDFARQRYEKKDPKTLAKELLKAFRKELVYGKSLIKKDDRPTEDEIQAIDNALRNIMTYLAHYPGS